ncbi:hypothetical protein [Duganella hordei]
MKELANFQQASTSTIRKPVKGNDFERLYGLIHRSVSSHNRATR